MAGGLIKGMAAGAIVSGLGLAGVSLMLPLPAPAPAEAVALPETSDFARPGEERPPVAPAASPAPEEPAASPAAPARTPVNEPAALPATEPPARPETAVTPPMIAPPPQTPAVALETPPLSEPTMPVPPPGEAAAPDLPPAEIAPAPGSGGEITLMPDGALVPQSPDRPRVIAPGDSAGFAAAEGTKVNRLPQVGSKPQGSSVPPSGKPTEPFGKAEPAPADPGPATPPEATGPALERFAAAFAEKPGKPYLTVLLVDVGTAAGGLDAQTIAALGPWVTVVLDPAAPGVGASAETYRAAGLEVTMLAGSLPAGATPQDLEVALAAWQRAVPQAVALVEPETPVLQGSARLVAQAEKALAAEGLGYVMQPGGIGAPASAATPRAGIFRVLDARRDKAAVITRTLGRAAFEAGKEGATVVMLSAWPESVAGLTAWAAEEGANYNLTPLSALIRAQKTK